MNYTVRQWQSMGYILVAATIAMLMSACSHKQYINNQLYHFTKVYTKPDYSSLECWAAHPWKWDPSDSVPAPLRTSFISDSIADVFFIHPTTQTDATDEKWNADINDSTLNIKTDYSTILYQASAFNSECRVFAPRYRQAHLRAFFDKNKMKAAVAFDIAYSDIKKAFEYYLLHYNQGRPIIIASHSQGTIHAGLLIKEFFEEKPLYNKLICAYLIGMPVPTTYFKTLQPCKDSLSTGCFVTWRTYQRNYIDSGYIAKETFKSYVVNPLSWDTTTQYIHNENNKGGLLKNFNKIKPGIVDAQIHDNILWTCKPKFFGNIFFTQKNYHVGDINLFYNNIRQNLHTRIAMYRKH